MRAYPSSFRELMDLIAGNGLKGADLQPGSVVAPPPWMARLRAGPEAASSVGAREQPAASGSSGPAEVTAAAAGGDTARAGADVSASSGSDDGCAAGGASTAGEATSSGEGSFTSAAAAEWRPGDKVQVVLVGATVTAPEVEDAVSRHWACEPVVVRVGEPGCVPTGLRHRALLVADAGRRLATLVAMLRRDLAQAGQDDEPARVGLRRRRAPPRSGTCMHSLLAQALQDGWGGCQGERAAGL